MRRYSGVRFSIALLASVVGCAGTPEPVPVVAEPMDLALLQGEWRGEYRASTVRRSGSILFRLEAGSDTAFGDVVMIPADADRPLGPPDLQGGPEADPSRPQVLRIAFVRVEKGTVSGTLEPYRDPDCGCAVSTTFTGTLEGDEISGTFVAVRGAGGGRFSGSWRVSRVRP